MKRLILISALLFLVAGHLQARNPSFGLKAGLNFSRLPSTISGASPDYIVSSLSDSYTGFHVGLFGQFVFGGGFFQPELLYTQNGRDMHVELVAPAQEDGYFVEKFSHLVMPLHVGAKLGPIKLSAAPVFSLLINSWNDLEIDQDFASTLSKLTLGYQLGAGLQLGSLMLDFRYEAGLTKFGDGVTIGGQTIKYDTRPHQYILSLGFRF